MHLWKTALWWWCFKLKLLFYCELVKRTNLNIVHHILHYSEVIIQTYLRVHSKLNEICKFYNSWWVSGWIYFMKWDDILKIEVFVLRLIDGCILFHLKSRLNKITKGFTCYVYFKLLIQLVFTFLAIFPTWCIFNR